MPLDTSIYALSLLRLDGRRWNELRRIHAQISTQAASDGSSYLEMGNTKVICTVSGPRESPKGRSAALRGGLDDDNAEIEVGIGVAGFSGVDRKRRGRGDKRTQEMQSTLSAAFSSNVFTHLYPHSTITLTLHVLSQDGSLLAACVNAGTLALIDAGIPMADYLVACTSGSTSSFMGNDGSTADPLLDLNGQEEMDVPWLTVGTIGASEKVSICVMDTKVRVERLEGMLAVGVDGCKQVREILDEVVRKKGTRILEDSIK